MTQMGGFQSLAHVNWDMGLCDVWRELYYPLDPSLFIPLPTDPFQGLIMFFIAPAMLHIVQGSDNKPTPWMDHDLIVVSLHSWHSYNPQRQILSSACSERELL